MTVDLQTLTFKVLPQVFTCIVYPAEFQMPRTGHPKVCCGLFPSCCSVVQIHEGILVWC